MGFSVQGASQGASAGSAAGPWGAAAGAVLGGFMGGGEADTPSSAVSGIGRFDVENSYQPTINQRSFNAKNPIHILVVGGIVCGAIWAWKKAGKK